MVSNLPAAIGENLASGLLADVPLEAARDSAVNDLGFVLRPLCEEQPPCATPSGRLEISQEGQDHGPLVTRLHREIALLPG